MDVPMSFEVQLHKTWKILFLLLQKHKTWETDNGSQGGTSDREVDQGLSGASGSCLAFSVGLSWGLSVISVAYISWSCEETKSHLFCPKECYFPTNTSMHRTPQNKVCSHRNTGLRTGAAALSHWKEILCQGLGRGAGFGTQNYSRPTSTWIF